MKIANVTNAPPQAGMGKPAREVYNRLVVSSPDKGGRGGVSAEGITADFFYLDAIKKELSKNGEKIAAVGMVPKFLDFKPIHWWRLARKLPKEGYGFWHLTNQTLSFIPRQDFLLTVYDLIELLEPQEKFGKYVARFLYKGISKAKHIICISEYTKKMLQKTYAVPDEKISIIPLGVSAKFNLVTGVKQSLGYLEFLRQQKLPRDAKIILYVGSDHPRKNLKIVAEALNIVRKTAPNTYLIKVGDPGLRSGREEFMNKLEQMKLRDAVRFVGNVADDGLQQFYTFADVFVFPSLYEGFGVPPLEAMACGCPVVCSNATSLPEVVGDAGVLLNPLDATGFAAAIVKILSDANYASELSRKGLARSKKFAWDEIAQKTAEVYEKMLTGI